MDDKDDKIKLRLEEVLASILCPVAGCWSLHGGHFEYYFDQEAEAHVLEAWPVGVEEQEEYEGNGHQEADPGLLYELAEFDFTQLATEISLEFFHFSQRRSLFEITWKENGKQLELRVHILPVEVAED
jgi:hypothetical protein